MTAGSLELVGSGPFRLEAAEAAYGVVALHNRSTGAVNVYVEPPVPGLRLEDAWPYGSYYGTDRVDLKVHSPVSVMGYENGQPVRKSVLIASGAGAAAVPTLRDALTEFIERKANTSSGTEI